MAKALGIGGVFFKSKDPVALTAWYAEHLAWGCSESTRYPASCVLRTATCALRARPPARSASNA